MLQNQRMRLTGAGVDAVHIHEDIIMGSRDPETGPEWAAGGYPARRYPAADRSGPAAHATSWISSDDQGVDLRVLDMPVHAQEVAVIGSRMPGGGVGAAEGNTSGQCLIVSQAWTRTVRSYRSVPSLPTPG